MHALVVVEHKLGVLRAVVALTTADQLSRCMRRLLNTKTAPMMTSWDKAHINVHAPVHVGCIVSKT